MASAEYGVPAQMSGLREGSAGKVIVVDDDASMREMFRALLEKKGYIVEEAPNGIEGLDLCLKILPDVVLLDVVMPEMDGIEVCRQLRADPRTAHLPVLLVSGADDDEIQAAGIEAGANDFLRKPARVRDMLFRVRNMANLSRLFMRIDCDRAKLCELKTARDELTRLVVHDMRGPLGTLTGSMGVLRDNADLSKQSISQSLQVAHASVTLLQEMVESLLDFELIEFGVKDLDIQSTELGQLTQAIVKEFEPLADANSIVLHRSATPCRVGCDVALTTRVLRRLLWDALRLSPPGDGVRVKIENDGRDVRISVFGPYGACSAGLTEIAATHAPDRQGLDGWPQGFALTFCKLAVEAQGGHAGVDGRGEEARRVWFSFASAGTQAPEDDIDVAVATETVITDGGS